MVAPRRRRTVTPAQARWDLWLALALFVGAILSGWLGHTAGLYGEEVAPLLWSLPHAAALTLPLALRRRYPTTVLFIVAITFMAGGVLRIPEMYVSNVALFIAMYTVGAWVEDRRRAAIVRLIVVAAMLVWLLVTIFQAATTPDDSGFSRAGFFSPFAAFALIQFLVNIAYFGGAYYFGERAWNDALSRKALQERTAELERERELTAAQAVALDRVRVARELHDVVAHHVSAMGVQAGAARAVLDRDPAAARAALTTVESSARDALEELRGLLDTLRTNDTDPPGGSTLRLSGLPDLVEHSIGAGMPTTLAIIGTPREVPDLVHVNLYRIAQEALTNARRHGGQTPTAEVRLRYSKDAVELDVSNTGSVRSTTRAGLGIVGMRERAAASRGTIEAGPRPRGDGYLVRVRIPEAASAS